MTRDLGCGALVAIFVAVFAATGVDAQQTREIRIMRPDRWFIATSEDQLTDEETHRMLYLARDGTMLMVQCASRDGEKTGGWAFMVRREDWAFPTAFVDGWWSVDAEPINGPLQWGGSGKTLLLNDDALKDRLREPVESRIRFRVTHGEAEWNLEFTARDLASSVERFAPSCEVA